MLLRQKSICEHQYKSEKPDNMLKNMTLRNCQMMKIGLILLQVFGCFLLFFFCCCCSFHVESGISLNIRQQKGKRKLVFQNQSENQKVPKKKKTHPEWISCVLFLLYYCMSYCWTEHWKELFETSTVVCVAVHPI